MRYAIWLAVLVQLLAVTNSLAQVPSHVWSLRFGSTSADLGTKVAADASGNVFVTGHFAGTVNFGGLPLTSAGNVDAMLVKYDSNGNHQWSRRFGGTSADDGWDVATDPSGNVVVIGSFQGSADFGGGVFTSAGRRDIFLAKYDPSGAHLWSRQVGGTDDDFGYSVAVDPSGFIAAAGRQFVPPFGFSIFLYRYDPDGNLMFTRFFDQGLSSLDATAVAVDSDGNAFLTGSFTGPLDFGGGPLTSSEYDVFLAKYDPSGTHLWSKRFGSQPRDAAYDVVTDPSGAVVITGFFGFSTAGGTINFGGGPLVGAGSADIFVAKFDGNGVHQWSQRFGGTDFDTANSVACDADGNVAITGRFRPLGADFGGGSLPVAGLNDVFVAKFSASGVHQWSQRFGGTNSEVGNGVSADPTGAFLLTGDFASPTNFGGGPLTSAGANDGFVVKLDDPQPVPVLITSFTATPRAGSIQVQWSLWSDETIDRVTLYRRQGEREYFEIVADMTGADETRSYIDNRTTPRAQYDYQLSIQSLNGEFRSPVVTAIAIALVGSLGPNRPNPFNPSTWIEYTMSERKHVAIVIHDATGALIARLDEGVRDAGTHRVQWNGRATDGRAVASGVYFYRLEGAPSLGARKMVLLK